MLAAIKLIQTQLNAQIKGGTDRTPLHCTDEYTRLMHSSIASPLTTLVEAVTQEGPKVSIFCQQRCAEVQKIIRQAL